MIASKHFSFWSVALLCIALALMTGTGCKHKPQELNPGFDENAGAGNGDNSGLGDNSGYSGSGLPNIDPNTPFSPSDPNFLKPVYFDFDSCALRPDAMAALRQNAANLKSQSNLLIQIAGHCDERGTQEYNVALGERRALAVRSYLMQQGVSGDRMITISYGEESPAVFGHDEAAFAKNRRCEFNQAVSR